MFKEIDSKAINPVATADEWAKLEKLCDILLKEGEVNYHQMLHYVGPILVPCGIEFRLRNRVSKLSTLIWISPNDVKKLKDICVFWDKIGIPIAFNCLSSAVITMLEKKIASEFNRPKFYR